MAEIVAYGIIWLNLIGLAGMVLAWGVSFLMSDMRK